MAKIFIVEDDVALREIYKQLLTFLGHQIISEAFDGEDAIKKYTNF